MDILLIVAVFGALALLQSVLITRLGLRSFSYGRRFSSPTASAGDTVELIEVIRNRSLLFLPWVRLEMRMPSSFLFRTREEVDIRGERYHKSVFTLMPFSQVTRRHHVTVERRGHFVLSQASMSSGDLMGMKAVARTLDAPAEIFVLPVPLFPGDGLLPSSRAQGEVSVQRWIQPDPFLVNGIREYRAGDAEKEIHWAATARTGNLQVKTHDYTADPRLMVLINMQKTEAQWGDLMDYEQERVEQAISMAAGLCCQALRRGMEAGFAANMPLDEAEESAFLPPARGTGREETLLRAMACLRVRRTLSFPSFLKQLPPLSGCDIVILSCYDSPAIREQMALMRRLGNSVTLLSVPEVSHA